MRNGPHEGTARGAGRSRAASPRAARRSGPSRTPRPASSRPSRRAGGGRRRQELLDVPGHGAHVGGVRHQRRLAVHGVVAGPAVVAGDQGTPARHRLHGGEPEPLDLAGLHEDPAAVVDLLGELRRARRQDELHPLRERVLRLRPPEDQHAEVGDRSLDDAERGAGRHPALVEVVVVEQPDVDGALVDAVDDPERGVIEAEGHVHQLGRRHTVVDGVLDQPGRDAHLEARELEEAALEVGGEHVAPLVQQDGQPGGRRRFGAEDDVGLGDGEPVTDVDLVVDAVVEGEPVEVVERVDVPTPEPGVEHVDLVATPRQGVGELVEHRHPAHRDRLARAGDGDDHRRLTGCADGARWPPPPPPCGRARPSCAPRGPPRPRRARGAAPRGRAHRWAPSR